MKLKSLKSKLVIAVFTLVIASGMLISLLVTQRFSSNLREAMNGEARHLAQAAALEAADKVLINDRVSLQKMLDHQIRSNPSIAYLFIYRDSRVLAHTFPNGVPIDLINANLLESGNQSHSQEVASTEGEHYLDIAWPIFDGDAGVLRLGFSQIRYRQQLAKLWQQMAGLTLTILLLALTVTLFFVKRVTRPLAELASATHKVNQGEQGVRVQVDGEDEVATLAASFNHMVGRIEDYTQRLEEQTLDLERAHHQTRTVCGVVQEIGALRSLSEISSHLIKTFQNVLKCDHLVLLTFSSNRNLLFVSSENETRALNQPESIEATAAILKGKKKVTFTKKGTFWPPLVPKIFQTAARQAIVPLRHENQQLGALVSACPGECQCNVEELNVANLMLDQTAGVVKRAVLQEEEIHELQSLVDTRAEFGGIIGKDPKMQLIYKLIEDIAPTDATVLIQGQSGTGKELVARAIHRRSPRRDKPFVVINCSAYPATLLESELFGHEKGAFTGAIRQKSGRFEQAHGGTVFLDEIGEIPLSAQIKLLRVLQTQKFERLGGEKTLTVNVRILAATNKDLLGEVKRGNFREDLYYRLNVIPIFLPPLKERRNDIPLLARHFIRQFASSQGKTIDELSPEATRLLLNYDWPGNVRELENSIEHATVLAKGSQLEAFDLPAMFHDSASPSSGTRKESSLVEHEKRLFQEVLEECSWNKKQAAQRLGISRSTLYDKLKKYQITKPTSH